MLEYWYEIWGANLVTTSNLALNKAWRAKLPIIQTGDEFVTVENFDYASQLHQFENRAANLALKLGNLELCKRFPKPDVTEAAKLGHLEIIQWIAPKWPNYELNSLAAAHGHRHIVDWIIDHGQPHANMIVGAASHSKEMLQYVWDRLPNCRLVDNQKFIDALYIAALENQENLALVTSWGFNPTPSEKLLCRCIEFEHLDLFETYAQQVQPLAGCYIYAKSVQAMQVIAKYIAPTQSIVFGYSKEILQWLSQYCSIQTAWYFLNDPETASFLDKIRPPPPKWTPTTLPMLKWFEKHYPNLVNYDSVLCTALHGFEPKFTHYVREKATLNGSHILSAISSHNHVQLEWLLQRCGVPLDLRENLCCIRCWKIAFSYNLYKWPFPISDEFDQGLVDWLTLTGQLIES